VEHALATPCFLLLKVLPPDRHFHRIPVVPFLFRAPPLLHPPCPPFQLPPSFPLVPGPGANRCSGRVRWPSSGPSSPSRYGGSSSSRSSCGFHPGQPRPVISRTDGPLYVVCPFAVHRFGVGEALLASVQLTPMCSKDGFCRLQSRRGRGQSHCFPHNLTLKKQLFWQPRSHLPPPPPPNNGAVHHF
jgi:hypothetical protein